MPPIGPFSPFQGGVPAGRGGFHHLPQALSYAHQVPPPPAPTAPNPLPVYISRSRLPFCKNALNLGNSNHDKRNYLHVKQLSPQPLHPVIAVYTQPKATLSRKIWIGMRKFCEYKTSYRAFKKNSNEQ